MLSFLRELGLILLLVAIGSSYSLLSGLSPLPWAEPELAAGEIKPEDARVLDTLWVDARSETEYAAGHIPGAVLLNEEDWDQGVSRLMVEWLERPRPIVVYCASTTCGTSKRVAARLREALPAGEIYSLHGGWNAWQN